jgi:hypothetical protein
MVFDPAVMVQERCSHPWQVPMIEQCRSVLNSQILVRPGATSRSISAGGIVRRSNGRDSAEAFAALSIAMDSLASLITVPLIHVNPHRI